MNSRDFLLSNFDGAIIFGHYLIIQIKVHKLKSNENLLKQKLCKTIFYYEWTCSYLEYQIDIRK